MAFVDVIMTCGSTTRRYGGDTQISMCQLFYKMCNNMNAIKPSLLVSILDKEFLLQPRDHVFAFPFNDVLLRVF